MKTCSVYNHRHSFTIKGNEGETDVVKDHKHKIKIDVELKGTRALIVTEEAAGHKHPITLRLKEEVEIDRGENLVYGLMKAGIEFDLVG